MLMKKVMHQICIANSGLYIFELVYLTFGEQSNLSKQLFIIAVKGMYMIVYCGYV